METIKERRERFEQLGKLYPKAASVTTEQAFLGGVNCYWLIPENAAHNKIVVYLHGGAFAVGSILSHESMVSHFAAKLNTKILFVDYSLAPEKPFPAAVNDVVNVYKELLITYPNHKISFIGDSAGGGLIVSLCGELLKQQAKLPHAAIMISPWISLECNNPSHEGNRQKDVILTREYATASANDYTGSTPFAISSPEHVVLSQFPPVLIMVGTNEILFDDSTNLYELIKPIQPNSTLSIYPGQYHVWPLANINSEASQKAIEEIESFLSGL